MNYNIARLTLLLAFLFLVTTCQGQMKNNMGERSQQIDRKPQVAGSFYPSDSLELQSALSEAFSKAEPKKTSGNVVAIISPHAGYIYSAKVAASAFNQIDDSKHYEHIFVIGSSHHDVFEGASIYTSGDYITPLGHVRSDSLGKSLVNNFKVFTDNASPHMGEHTIEVQLPFLQYKLKKDIAVIPIILGTQSPETCQEIAKALRPYLNEKNLFVISTDFSHYPSYNTAQQVDAFMADAVISNTPATLISAVEGIEKRGSTNLLTGMCGWTSVLTLLDITSTLPNITIQKVDYQNSGDTRYVDKSRVVGYVAMAVASNASSNNQDFKLTKNDKQHLLTIARTSIDQYIRNHEKIKIIDTNSLSASLKTKCGAFVSLHIQGKLRGCIGSFRTDKPLYEVVQEMAIAAATSDYRFNRVTCEEVNSLEIELSVLTPMRKITSIDEIVLGKHGIYIKKGSKAGTLLPQVATDNNWTKEEFLGYCARDKAGIGWNGWKDAQIYTYEAIVFSEPHQ